MKYEEKEAKVSFISKDEFTCPVCETVFHREELLSGSGRLIAGMLTDELHRLYEPSVKYGDVYPLIYHATVCPECWFASGDKDFEKLPAFGKDRAMEDVTKRKADVKMIFTNPDFREPRDLFSGTAALYLEMRCYDFYSKEFSPTIKQAIASLRTGWLFDELNRKHPDQHYDWLARLFKRKASWFYSEAILREQKGRETLSGLKVFGPDTDKNYAYEGALYLSALLKFKYEYQDNPGYRAEVLNDAKRTIAKIFGVAKSSKSKPGPLPEHARALYDNISRELNEADA